MIEFINLSGSDIIKPIYRIISFDRLIKLFNSNTLTLVKPGKWDDPFENIISKTKIYTENSFVEIGLRDNVHGICWSKRSVSDAMWRIYSSDKKAVRIKSTPEIISHNVDSWLNSHSNSKCFIGKVDYITTKDIRQKAKDFTKRVMAGKTERAIAESLLFKRNSFSHEEEIRVILIENDGASTNGLLNVEINPHELIQSVVIDSRAPDEIIDVYMEYLKNKIKYKGSISKSTLYAMPKPVSVKYKLKRKIKLKKKPQV